MVYWHAWLLIVYPHSQALLTDPGNKTIDGIASFPGSSDRSWEQGYWRYSLIPRLFWQILGTRLLIVLHIIIFTSCFHEDPEIATPPLSGAILPGVTRKSLLELGETWVSGVSHGTICSLTLDLRLDWLCAGACERMREHFGFLNLHLF